MSAKTMCVGGGSYAQASEQFERGLLPNMVRTLKSTGDTTVVLVYEC